MIGQQVVGVQVVLGDAPGEGLVIGSDRFPPLNKARQFGPDLGIDLHSVLGQDADMLAKPVGLDGDVARPVTPS